MIKQVKSKISDKRRKVFEVSAICPFCNETNYIEADEVSELQAYQCCDHYNGLVYGVNQYEVIFETD